MNRAQTIKAIHAIYPSLGIDKEQMYDLLEHSTKKRSIRACTDIQLSRHLERLNKLKIAAQQTSNSISDSQKRYIMDLEKKLGWTEQPERLEGFVTKMTKAKHLNWLTKRQASNVIEGLKSLLNRQKEVNVDASSNNEN